MCQVLIEGQPKNYAKLVTNRPDAISFNMANCEREGTVAFSADGDLTSGITQEMPGKFISKFRQGKDATINVPFGPLAPLIRSANLTRIDMLSIDVEGAELMVLNTMDWSLLVHVVVIEMDGFDKAKDDKSANSS